MRVRTVSLRGRPVGDSKCLDKRMNEGSTNPQVRPIQRIVRRGGPDVLLIGVVCMFVFYLNTTG